MPDKYVVLIDAVGTTSYLPEQFVKRGIKVIHIDTGAKEEYLKQSYKRQFFDIEIQMDANTNIDNMIKVHLEGKEIIGVITGLESGLVLCDQLAAKLRLSQNDPNTTDMRRFKHKMADKLAEKGLAHITHLQTDNAQEIIAWANKHNYWPIVIKPIDGAGTEGLSVCQRASEVEEALNSIKGKQSVLGHKYNAALAQPFIKGDEYAVNAVSVTLPDGTVEHRITDIWTSKKTKVGDNVIYDRMELIASTGYPQDALAEYMKKVLDALEVKRGPTHSELFFTDKGALLIEVNMRIMGLSISQHQQERAFETQISLTAESFVNPENFLEMTKNPYRMKKHIVCALHQVTGDNCVVDETAIPQITGLSTFAMHKFPSTGPVPRTTDLINSPGWVLFIGEDKKQIDKEIFYMRALEKKLFSSIPQLQQTAAASSSVNGVQGTVNSANFVVGDNSADRQSDTSAMTSPGSGQSLFTTICNK